MSLSNLQPGFRLGKYEVLAHIATGGMGTVFKALDLELRRTIALKVLPNCLAQNSSVLERFRREARHAARLSHPNIVTLYECGFDTDHELHYLALEYVDGIDLSAHIESKGRLQPEETRRILIQAAKALEHAFEHGVIHRDIKPSNFLLTRVRNKLIVKLTDLGLARVADDDDFKVTREGTTVGTIDYLSPEQARDSRAADVRSDIYSLGCTAYHMLAGKAPFADGGLGERIYKHLEVAPADVRMFNPLVSEDFWAILWKMLAKKPEDRYATPRDLLHALKDTAGEVSAIPTPPKRTNRRRTEIPSQKSGIMESAAPAEPVGNQFTARQEPRPSSSGTDAEYQRTRPALRQDDLAESRPYVPPRPAPEPGPNPLPSEVDPRSLVTPEQMQTAAAFYQRAVRVLNEGGGEDYARQMLTDCVRLDPFTPMYRKTLRELNSKATSGTLSRWLGSLKVLAIKAKMYSARTNGDWRKVLEQGEEVLARQPADAGTHVVMAEVAEELGISRLALWFLEQGREQSPDNADLLRAMARLYERREEWLRALSLWEKVQELEPNDHEAKRMIDDLSVKDHIAKSNYRR